jgi:serine/threonine-protein kinase RsbW
VPNLSLAEEYRLRIDAKLSALTEVRDFVKVPALLLGLDDSAIYSLQLAVDEAVTNIIIHGYGGQGGPIEITARIDGDALIVQLTDKAKLFDPTSHPSPDLSKSPEERAAGGVGVFLMREGTDQVSYRPVDGGGNELTMIKRKAA